MCSAHHPVGLRPRSPPPSSPQRRRPHPALRRRPTELDAQATGAPGRRQAQRRNRRRQFVAVLGEGLELRGPDRRHRADCATISAPDCVGCNRYIDLYEQDLRTTVATFDGGDNSLRSVTAQRGTTGVYISGTLIAAPGHYVRQEGRAEKAFAGPNRPMVTYLARFSNGQWVMVDVGLTDSMKRSASAMAAASSQSSMPLSAQGVEVDANPRGNGLVLRDHEVETREAAAF